MPVSAIYEGQVRHARFLPNPHAFGYKAFMLLIDLDELPILFQRNFLWSDHSPNLAWFNRKDYYGNPAKPLKSEILDLVENKTSHRPDGAVRLLTNLRYFGYCFNPVSFYYCYDKGGVLKSIVSHITNTPWGETHAYVHAIPHATEDKEFSFNLKKDFHVSPFMPMDIDYAWRFSAPADTLLVHMKNLQGDQEVFNATLRLNKTEWSANRLNILLFKYPFMTLKVIFAIYYQALLLKLKRTPFHSHPKHQN